MSTAHNSAENGAFAKTVLMPGDPLRAKFIAENFLENVKLVTSVRNVYGYTGTYKGVPVSVMASGMGMPSIGIYSYELYSFYGVENIIRIGSAGSYRENLPLLGVCLGEYSYSESSFAKVQGGVEDRILYPSPELNEMILKTAEEIGIPCSLAKICSSDVFYSQPEMGGWEAERDRSGCDCVEMESFALFHNANMLGKRAACILTISNCFITNEETTAEERQNSFTNMMRLALESAIRL